MLRHLRALSRENDRLFGNGRNKSDDKNNNLIFGTGNAAQDRGLESTGLYAGSIRQYSGGIVSLFLYTLVLLPPLVANIVFRLKRSAIGNERSRQLLDRWANCTLTSFLNDKDPVATCGPTPPDGVRAWVYAACGHVLWLNSVYSLPRVLHMFFESIRPPFSPPLPNSNHGRLL